MPRSSARRAAGKGPNGPSFDASLTTRSRPSSRWTSSTGFPGSYGTSSASDRRKKRSSTSGTPEAYALPASLFALPSTKHEPERARCGPADRGDQRLVGPLRLRVDVRDRSLSLPLRDSFADLEDHPADDGVSPVHDSHGHLPSLAGRGGKRSPGLGPSPPSSQPRQAWPGVTGGADEPDGAGATGARDVLHPARDARRRAAGPAGPRRGAGSVRRAAPAGWAPAPTRGRAPAPAFPAPGGRGPHFP